MNQRSYLKLFSQSCIATMIIVFASLSHAGSGMEHNKLAQELNQNWNQLFNQGNAKAVADLYSETAILSPGNGQILKGKQAIEALFKSFIDGGVHNHTIEVVESYREGSTLYQVSNWQASGEEQDGVTPTFGGVVTLISQVNDKGEWKLKVHSWNTAE